MLRLTLLFLFIIVFSEEVTCKKLRQEISEIQSDGNASGERTLMIGKLVLLPILAGVGVKFLVLLPIILSKIALLGILSFVSSNLSLLVSAVLGIRSYFFGDKPTEEDYDYDYRNKNRHEFYEPNKYVGHQDINDDHRHYEDDYDAHDNNMHRYKGYKSLHSGYNPYYAEYRYHDDHKLSKKRLRPFKLLGRIKDVIKDHFYKSEVHGQRNREYNHDQKHHSYEPHDNRDKYNDKSRETKHRNSEHSMSNNNQDRDSDYYEAYVVPEDWSQKNRLMGSFAVEDEENQKNSMSMSDGSDDTQLDISSKDDDGKPASKYASLTSSTTGYNVNKDYRKSKKSFIVLGIRPHKKDSDPPVAFYATDYKITDSHTVPRVDTNK